MLNKYSFCFILTLAFFLFHRPLSILGHEPRARPR